jgi:arylsulfatase A-like enzyme
MFNISTKGTGHMPRSKRSTPAIGAAFGAVAGIVFFAALAVVELSSLLPSQYQWMGKSPFGWLSNAAVAYSLFYYGIFGVVFGALAGAALFWIMSLRGRLIAVTWGWLPVSLAGFVFLLIAGGLVLNVWIMPPKSQFGFYIWNGLYAVACLFFSLIVGLAVRSVSGLASPRPKVNVAGMWRKAAVILVLLGIYYGAGVAMVAWTGGRAEDRLKEAAQAAGSAGRPNVLLVVIETTRADHVSCYGYERQTTPNIDKWMAEQGALFEDPIVQAPFSGPSKASIATGRYPHSHGVRDHPQLLPYDEVTLAEVFKAQGYVTAGIGAGAWQDPQYGYHQGCDSFNSITTSYDRRRFWPFVHTFRLSLNKIAPWYTTPDERMKVVGADRAVDMARDWMQSKHDDGVPFFMHLEFNEPHAIYEPPQPFDTQFGPTDKAKAFMKELKDGVIGTGVSRYDYESLGKDPDVLEQTVALYDGEIAYVDHELGRLFDAMSSGGYLESTVIAVTADHGENFGEHDTYFCHTFLYNTSVRVPLLMRYPREVTPGTRVEGPVELIDIFPTLLDLAGVPTDGLPLDGISLADSMTAGRGKTFAFTESRFYHPSFTRYTHYRLSVPGAEGKWTSVRYGDLKLIRIPTLAGDEWELYDLAKDPGEKRNLYGDHPLQDFLQGALERWMAKASEPAQPVTIDDEETRERLRSLGYID